MLRIFDQSVLSASLQTHFLTTCHKMMVLEKFISKSRNLLLEEGKSWIQFSLLMNVLIQDLSLESQMSLCKLDIEKQMIMSTRNSCNI